MIINVYTIFDVKAQFYNKPFYLANDSVAVRTFSDLANDPQTDVAKHPEDYILFALGTYNDETAKIEWNEPKTMCRAHELINRESIKTEETE